jgi:hypothetical protein
MGGKAATFAGVLFDVVEDGAKVPLGTGREDVRHGSGVGRLRCQLGGFIGGFAAGKVGFQLF